MQDACWRRVSGGCWSLGNALRRRTFQEAVAGERTPGSSDRPRHAQNQVRTELGGTEVRPPGNRPQLCWAVRFSEAAPGLGSCGGDAKEAESAGRVGRCGDLAGASPGAAAGWGRAHPGTWVCSHRRRPACALQHLGADAGAGATALDRVGTRPAPHPGQTPGGALHAHPFPAAPDSLNFRSGKPGKLGGFVQGWLGTLKLPNLSLTP